MKQSSMSLFARVFCLFVVLADAHLSGRKRMSSSLGTDLRSQLSCLYLAFTFLRGDPTGAWWTDGFAGAQSS